MRRNLPVEPSGTIGPAVSANFVWVVGAYSISKSRICVSPEAVMMVRSEECGMNFTEKMFCRWPVAICVLSEKPSLAL